MADPNNDDQEFDLEVFDRVMKINLYGSIYAAKYCVEAMKANERNENNQRGCFVFTSSISGHSGGAG
jgi:NAD(P)-dependent dehydrogenase (short-subunit alcohol dehydrogenase family)